MERFSITDSKVYPIPDGLDDLKGPGRGRIQLGLMLYWGPEKPLGFDLSDPSDVITAYSNILANATIDDCSRLVNKDLLIRYWSRLHIDRTHIRSVWDKKFDCLARKEHLNEDNRSAERSVEDTVIESAQ
jgi:hypothetical protein